MRISKGKGNIPTSSLPDETHSEDWEGYSKEWNWERGKYLAHQCLGNDATWIERERKIPSVLKYWLVQVTLRTTRDLPGYTWVRGGWGTKEIKYYLTKLDSLQAVKWLQVRFKSRRNWNSGAKQSKSGAGLEYSGKARKSTIGSIYKRTSETKPREATSDAKDSIYDFAPGRAVAFATDGHT